MGIFKKGSVHSVGAATLLQSFTSLGHINFIRAVVRLNLLFYDLDMIQEMSSFHSSPILSWHSLGLSVLSPIIRLIIETSKNGSTVSVTVLMSDSCCLGKSLISLFQQKAPQSMILLPMLNSVLL